MSLRDRFAARFFRPAPTLDLAILRLLVVGLQLFVILFPYTLFTYPVWGRLELLAALPDSQWRPLPVLRLLLLPFGDGFRPPLAAMVAVKWIAVATGFLALGGWRTRTACLLFALCNLLLSAYGYSYGEYHHIEALTIVTLFALAASPSGAALSLDSLGARGAAPATSELAAWPLELVRWLFALTYLSSALCKVLGSGLDWMNGFTLQAYLLQEGIFWGTSSSVWLANHHGLCVALSWITVVVEAFFWLVVVWPRTAWVLVPAAAALHVGIEVTMRAPFWLYLPLYAAFVPWARLLARK